MGISELTALELGKEIKEKRISVREAVQASLERIHKYEAFIPSTYAAR